MGNALYAQEESAGVPKQEGDSVREREREMDQWIGVYMDKCTDGLID